MVGITVHLTFARRACALTAWYRAQGSVVVLGVLHVLSCPQKAQAHADAIAIGDGVVLWPQILADLERGCLLLAPLALGIAAATWLEDGGAPRFRQERIGAQRRPFTVLKFRTYAHGRVTRVGAVLRRTGLDELPQFLNVWRGQMSLVGPRPLTVADLERLDWSGFDWRFAMEPGITGVAQLFGGLGARHSRRLDRLYLRRQSLPLDARLIALSAAVNLLGKPRLRRWLRRLGR